MLIPHIFVSRRAERENRAFAPRFLFLLSTLACALMLSQVSDARPAKLQAKTNKSAQSKDGARRIGLKTQSDPNDVKAPETRIKRGGTKYAVIIGVNDYGSSAPTLRYAVSDAKRLYNMLTDPKVGSLPGSHIALLTSEDSDDTRRPTAENIRRSIEEMIHKTKSGDQFWFYFAGHGIEYHQLSYLLPQGFACSNLNKTALSTRSLRQLLDKECRASEKVIILDACQSGSARSLSAAPPLRQTMNGTGMVTLAACSVNQSAWELPDMRDGSGGGGVFTYYVVSGLKRFADSNRDGYISVNELGNYVVANVSDEVMKARRIAQTPQFITHDAATTLNQVYLSHVSGEGSAPNAPAPDMSGLEDKKPLPPALMVILNGPGGAGNAAENAVIKRLLEKGFLIADKQAANLLHNITGDQQLAQAADKRGAVYLTLGEYTITTSSPVPPFVTYNVTISARLVDAQGNAVATARGVSNPHAGGDGEAQAIDDAVDKFVDELATSTIKKAIGMDKAQP